MEKEVAEQLSVFADIATVLIALAALSFTVYSTWYMYWRAGRLVAGRVSVFMAGTMMEGAKKVPIIGVPLRVTNAGARSMIIDGVRLVIQQGQGPATFQLDRTEVDMLDPKTAKSWTALPLLINPSTSKELDCIFACRNPGFDFRPLVYSAKLELLISERVGWSKLLEFNMDFSKSDNIGMFDLENYFKPYVTAESVNRVNKISTIRVSLVAQKNRMLGAIRRAQSIVALKLLKRRRCR